jgi:hypothetical protein
MAPDRHSSSVMLSNKHPVRITRVDGRTSLPSATDRATSVPPAYNDVARMGTLNQLSDKVGPFFEGSCTK